jgi:succinyl-CoA synthetase beta subunit
MDAGGGRQYGKPPLRLWRSFFPPGLKPCSSIISAGLTRCDDVASAFVQVKETMDIPIPVVISFGSTNEEKESDFTSNTE